MNSTSVFNDNMQKKPDILSQKQFSVADEDNFRFWNVSGEFSIFLGHIFCTAK